jgi:hypothetical protein
MMQLARYAFWMLFAIYVVLMTACLLGAVTAVVELVVKRK